jgi:hypothetical protein
LEWEEDSNSKIVPYYFLIHFGGRGRGSCKTVIPFHVIRGFFSAIWLWYHVTSCVKESFKNNCDSERENQAQWQHT